jgi:hypothetical protein
MSEELSVLVPVHTEAKIQVLMPELKPMPGDAGTVHLTPEQMQAQDAVLRQEAQNQESKQAAAFMGVWMGTLLLHDVVAEHLAPPADEESREKDEPDGDEPEDRS